MKQKQLSPEQSVRAAIIFLNLFGLRLQYGEKINKDDVLSILNSQNEEVGMLTFDNDEEIKACLGIDRNKMQYQTNDDNLIDAYFGIGEDIKFLPPDIQKRLLKK